MAKIRIRHSLHSDRSRLVYKDKTLIATISHEKPNRANNRAAEYGVHWTTGRTDWHDTYGEARDNALKG